MDDMKSHTTMNEQETIAQEKERIRTSVRARLALVSPVLRNELSRQAIALLERQPVWQSAKVVLGYLALRDEMDLFSAIETARTTGKTIALPRYVPDENAYCAADISHQTSFTRGAFGILEPPVDSPVLPLNRLDFVLVPGVAFDAWGRRLGRGKGFYDRLLAQVSGIKCGVALDEQVVEKLPSEAHDIAMNMILTPTRWLIMPPVGT